VSGPIASPTRVALAFKGNLLALVQCVECRSFEGGGVEEELGALVVDDEPEAAIADQPSDSPCAGQS
jgi:hypothetical protein